MLENNQNHKFLDPKSGEGGRRVGKLERRGGGGRVGGGLEKASPQKWFNKYLF